MFALHARDEKSRCVGVMGSWPRRWGPASRIHNEGRGPASIDKRYSQPRSEVQKKKKKKRLSYSGVAWWRFTWGLARVSKVPDARRSARDLLLQNGVKKTLILCSFWNEIYAAASTVRPNRPRPREPRWRGIRRPKLDAQPVGSTRRTGSGTREPRPESVWPATLPESYVRCGPVGHPSRQPHWSHPYVER